MRRRILHQQCLIALIIGLSLQSFAWGSGCLCVGAMAHSGASCCFTAQQCCCSESGECCGCCSDPEGIDSESYSGCCCGQSTPEPMVPAAPKTRQVLEQLLTLGDHSGLPAEIIPAVKVPSCELENFTQQAVSTPQILLCVWQT